MFSAKTLEGGYRKDRETPKKLPVDFYLGMLIDGRKNNSSDACLVSVKRGIASTSADVCVKDHGNLVASGSYKCFTPPWKSNKVKATIKAFEKAGIGFTRSDGTPINDKESDIFPTLVKNICKTMRSSEDEFIVVRRF